MLPTIPKALDSIPTSIKKEGREGKMYCALENCYEQILNVLTKREVINTLINVI
jgi:hypothetical protein